MVILYTCFCFLFWRSRRLVGIIKVLCFSVIPLAAIASLVVHILIQYEKIQVIDDSSNSIDDGDDMVKTIKSKCKNEKDIAISHGSI